MSQSPVARIAILYPWTNFREQRAGAAIRCNLLARFLSEYARLAPAAIEQAEALEQLRALWHGYRISVMVTEKAPHAGVDEASDQLDLGLGRQQGRIALQAIARTDVAHYVSALFFVYVVLILANVLISFVPRMPKHKLVTSKLKLMLKVFTTTFSI